MKPQAKQQKSKKLQVQHPAILLTKTTTVFVTISEQGQVTAVVQILLIKITMAFATTAPMLEINQEINARTDRESNTGMDREINAGMEMDRAADVEIERNGKSPAWKGLQNN